MANLKEYLRLEFNIRKKEELEEEMKKTSDIDIGLFVTPIFQKEQRSIAQ